MSWASCFFDSQCTSQLNYGIGCGTATHATSSTQFTWHIDQFSHQYAHACNLTWKLGVDVTKTTRSKPNHNWQNYLEPLLAWSSSWSVVVLALGPSQVQIAIQSHSPGGANVHQHVIHDSLVAHKFTYQTSPRLVQPLRTANTCNQQIHRACSLLFFSRPRSQSWPHHGRTFSIDPCPLILTDSSTGSPVHILMLSIQALRGLPRNTGNTSLPAEDNNNATKYPTSQLRCATTWLEIPGICWPVAVPSWF